MALIDQYKDTLNAAIAANYSRNYFSAFPESPKAYSETGMEDALKWFEKVKTEGHFHELTQTSTQYVGQEVSPFTQSGLHIQYPVNLLTDYIANAQKAQKQWKTISVENRAAILMSALDNFKARFFDVAVATMHTTGQAFMMSFQASGPHAADRALESIALGYDLLHRIPESVHWIKPMGKYDINIQKTFKAIGKGINVVIGCSTFPVWNTLPGVFAGLITGNPVIVKPHQGGILPIAIVVAEIQNALKAHNVDPLLIQLAADEADKPIAKILAEHPDVKIIDYTGNSKFGTYLESIPNKVVFTEKAGVNSVILDSVKELKGVADNIAFAGSLYSGQMCTAPQNIFIPESGIETAEGRITYAEVVEAIKTAVNNISTNPKMAGGVLGAIQNPLTLDRVKTTESNAQSNIQTAGGVENAEFPNARTSSPLIMELKAEDYDHYSEELFGPIMIVIKTKSIEQSVEMAQKLAFEKGAISCGLYCTDEVLKMSILEKMEEACVPVSINYTGMSIFMNQNAAFSDFHVTGGNPAGNATFTDYAFISRRFSWVGHKEMV